MLYIPIYVYEYNVTTRQPLLYSYQTHRNNARGCQQISYSLNSLTKPTGITQEEKDLSEVKN